MLPRPKLLVGRRPECDVQLRFPSVSGRHCELELVNGFWFVRDLGSSNGTRVNGKPCTAQWLMPNDVLWLAQHRFTISYAPPPGRPPPDAALPAPSPARTPEPAKTIAGPGPPAFVRPAAPAEAGRPSLGKLVPCGGGAPLLLLKPRLVLGRQDGCDIVLRFAPISGRHCELEWADGAWSVRDLGSRNGTRVDGVTVKGTQRLPPGSVLWLAGLRYEIVYALKGGAAAPPEKKPLFGQSLLEKAGLTKMAQGPTRGAADDDSLRQRYRLDETE
jgi:adenylate cyclase